MQSRWMKRRNDNGQEERFYPITHADAVVDLDTKIQENVESVIDSLSSHIENTDVHFSTQERDKLNTIEEGANKTIVDTSLSSTSSNAIANKAVQSAIQILTDSKANKSDIPNKVSQLTNDSGYLTSSTTPVKSVNGKTGAVTLTSSDVGLGNVNNTSDANKPVSTAQAAAIKVVQDGLNDHTGNEDIHFTATERTKLSGIATGANKYTHPSYTARTGVPTANQTPGFGGTFTVSQPVSDATGHITAVNSRTITIPSTTAGTSLGLVKTGGDVTITDGVITVNDDSHNHTIANIDNLQSSLDSKFDKAGGSISGNVTAPTFTGSLKGNADTSTTASKATKLETSRSLKVNLTTNNSQSFDGSKNADNIGVDGILGIPNGGTGAKSEGEARGKLHAMPLISKPDGTYYQLGFDENGIFIADWIDGFTFYIAGEEYICPYNCLSWGDWCDSQYNTGGFTWYGTSDSPICAHGSSTRTVVNNVNVKVIAGYKIIEGYNYNIYEEACCFAPGTKVLTSSLGDSKNIEEFSSGDTLISYNVETRKYYESVCQGLITNRNTTDIAEINFEDGTQLIMNAYHPILTINGFKSLTGYNGYAVLNVGDVAISINGESKIVSIDRYITEPIVTYNLMVKDINENPDLDTNDTYIANGIVVHNAACPT